ncbi:MAG: hypothetical protein K2W85_16140 [Phycisphaerales bacterium]|nr:hypothetical protein [Phycisphaerales bacterium]
MSVASGEVPSDERLRSMNVANRYASPWSWRVRFGGVLWHVVWLLLFRPTPKPLTPWRVFLLRLFGAKISGKVYIAPDVKVKYPWNLEMHDRSCLAYGAEVYNLGYCVLGEHAVVTQLVYLCGGTHDLSEEDQRLVVGRIEIEDEAFVGARALILPGVKVGKGAVVGAGAVVSKDVPPWMIVAGNPARPVRPRFHPRSIHGMGPSSSERSTESDRPTGEAR